MKNLIFDVGGVLVWPRLGDWNMPFGAARILGPRAVNLNTGKYLIACRKAVKWLDESRIVNGVEEERQLRRRYIQTLNMEMNWSLSLREIEDLTDDFTDNIERYGFFDDVKPWLSAWRKRYRLGILSDAMPSILKFLEDYGILGLFDGAVISTQVGAIKPSPEMYAAILGRLEARPEDCLFVDDRASNLEGAMLAGMRAVQMARLEFLPDPIWDGPVVRSFEELNRYLEEHP